MRYLNKIVFINSANIPYSEVMLDGNVHFGGTQGVGKSTVLRAILFFYTADKMRLGIQSGQKSFEEFYLPKSNSYIIYEVRTDYGFYTIMVSRSHGKPVYRFIDAPYRMEWFVDSDRMAFSDWILIRERIGKNIDISQKIDVFEQFRNIIFGNTRDRSHKYDKYALVESPKYQNIPRSIQNVFLNSKLDADFVKNTIIQSMTDVEDSINLSAYRPQVENFEREFEEISCWYKKDEHGNVPVRNKADRVIKTYQLLIAYDEEMRHTWRRLNYAVSSANETIPVIKEEISRLEENIREIEKKLANNINEYNREHDLLKEKIGVCNARLKDIRDKKKHYAGIDIDSILQLDSRRPVILNDRNLLIERLHSLEARFLDITEKYNRIRENIDNEQRSFEDIQAQELQRLRDSLQAKRDEHATRRDRRRKEIDDAYAQWLGEHEERMEILRSEHHRMERRLYELKSWHPKEKEIQEAEAELASLTATESSIRADLGVVRAELSSLRDKAIAETDRIRTEGENEQAAVRKEMEKLEAELEEISKVLGRLDGSLYQWLSENKPGWEQTIGKVADERSVLYATGLNPAVSENDGFYGITLDLDVIEPHHRTPDDYRARRKELEGLIAEKRALIKIIVEECNMKIKEINGSYNRRISEKMQLETTLRFQFEQIPLKRKDAETRLRHYRQAEAEMVETEKDKRRTELNEAVLAMDQEKKKLDESRARKDKDLKKADKDYSDLLKKQKNELADLRARQQVETEAKIKELEILRARYDLQEREELAGKGAETKIIEECRKELKGIEGLLAQIESQKHYVYEYRKDDTELFSKEEVFKNEKALLEKKDASVRQTYDTRRARYEKEKSDMSETQARYKGRLSNISDGLHQYDQLCSVENIVPTVILEDSSVEKSDCSCSDLVSQMRGAINNKRMKHDELKRAVNSFNSHFRPDNAFSFVAPHYDEDYPAFAVNLREFIENDKIEEFRGRLSEHYSNILSGISREVGMMMNHSAEINGIINEVNRDFRERNFAGVIRSIELCSEESSDRMMQLLRSIHSFTEENALSLGEVNLFSGDDHDRVNLKVVDYLKKLMVQLRKEQARTALTLSDTFTLKFRIRENDNDTGWVERISNVGSDGTDILVKAMVNIMLINVFKTKAARKNGDFIIHCMMDEIGKLHPSNVAGILQFANVRNIYLINSSPMSYNADIYRHNYLLKKDSKSRTHIKRLMTVNL